MTRQVLATVLTASFVLGPVPAAVVLVCLGCVALREIYREVEFNEEQQRASR